MERWTYLPLPPLTMYLYCRKIQKDKQETDEPTEKNKLQRVGVLDDHKYLKIFSRCQITLENLKMPPPASQAAQGKETECEIQFIECLKGRVKKQHTLKLWPVCTG